MSEEIENMAHATAWLFFFVLLSALMVIMAVLVSRHQKQQMFHQERMAALEKGTAIPLGPDPAPWSPRVYLLRGLIWTFTGAALVVGLYGISLSTQQPDSAQTIAWRAKNVAQDLQIPMDQARQIVEKDAAAQMHGMPAPVALLGLIPLAVGLAYLVFYYTDDSRKLPRGANPESLN
jgi:hypothetical protein